MLKELTNSFPASFTPFRPFAKARDRSAWQSLPDDLRAQIISDGENRLASAYPQVTAEDWLRFSRTGDRTHFESKYFERRRALCALILAECAEYKGRFMGDILDGIFSICEESAWQIPAHNTYIRDTPALPLPDVSRPLLDLFACETGALLATAAYLLGDELELLKGRIEYELENRIIKPYLSDWFWWMGGQGEPTNNWTTWCTQNILLTAFLTPIPDERMATILAKAAESLDFFLDDYGDDGCCGEGAQYYRHAGLCLFGALDIIDSVTGGAAAAVWQEEKIRNIARYILDVHVDGRYYINFSDCSPVAGRAGAREYLFGKRTGDAQLCDFAAIEWQIRADKTQPDDINLYYRTQSAFTAGEMEARAVPEKAAHREIFFPSMGLFIARDDVYCLAVRAGANDVSHGHNDTGGFMLYKNGKPYLIDVGVESYSKKTFSPQRYEIWTMQSSWHNLPDFDGVQQENGKDFRAKDVATSFGEKESRIQMRLENAWPTGGGLSNYFREISLHKGEKVTIADACDGDFTSAVLNLMFCVKPVVEGDEMELDGFGRIHIDGAKSIAIEEIPVTDSRLRLAWPETLYRARISFDKRIVLDIY